MIFSFLFIYIFVVNIVYFVVHIVCDCEVDVIANSLVLYLSFCSTLNKNVFFSQNNKPHLRNRDRPDSTSVCGTAKDLGWKYNFEKMSRDCNAMTIPFLMLLGVHSKCLAQKQKK